VGPWAKILGGFKRVQKSARELPLWMMAEFQVGKISTLVDTVAQFSCIREDVVEHFRRKGYPHKVSSCRMMCIMADGNRSTVTEAVKLRVKLLSFSWEHEFKIFKGRPFPVILGLDFLRRTGMSVDVSLRDFCFSFAPSEKGKFNLEELDVGHDNYLQHL
jgi:hypothetical protein